MGPIIIRNPIMTLTKLDAAGVEVPPAVDVSDDVSKVSLTPTIPTSNVTTFGGTYQSAGDPTWAGSVTIVYNADTATNWTPLVGFRARCQLRDRSDMTVYREFDTEILFNPALGGDTAPGQARTFDMALPVLSAVALVTPI